MKNSYKFFANKNCKYFPCHKNIDKEKFNCLFCFCPLYPLGENCGGNFSYTKTGIKDCSNCTIPHSPEGYEYILSKIDQLAILAKKQKNYNIDTLIFDLDGVIINSTSDIAISANYMLKKLGLTEKSVSLISTYIGHGSKKLISDCLETNDIEMIKKGLEIFKKHYTDNCTNTTTLRKHIEEILFIFREKNIVLLTQKPFEMTDKILKHFDIQKYFKLVLTPEKITRPKPYPDGILKAAKYFNTSPSRIVMIGDSPVDILAGKKANVLTIAVTDGIGNVENTNADIYINDLSEIIEYLYL